MTILKPLKPKVSWKEIHDYQFLLEKKQTSGVTTEQHIRLISLAYKLGRIPKRDYTAITNRLRRQLKQDQQVADKTTDL